MKKNWFVYMIETQKGRLYTGITVDLERRFQEHLSTHRGEGSKGAKYFRSDKPLRIAYREVFATRAEASQRESHIKKLNTKAKLALVAG